MHLQFTSHTKIVAFADDLLLLTEGSTSLEAKNFCNIELRKITHWAKDNKILFNEQKSQIMLITRKTRPDKKQVCIYLNNKKLKQVNSIKYLGIFFDEKFTFDQHIEHITDKCTKLIHALSRSAKIAWGLSHKAMRTIYQGAILPLILYGVPAWAKALN